MASPLGIALAQANQPIASYRPGAVAPTDIGTITAQSQNAAMQTYAAQLQQQNAMFGGLAGLGSAGVLAFGPKLAGQLFGSSATTPQVASMLGESQAPGGLLGGASASDLFPSAFGASADAAAPVASTALDAGTAAAGTDALAGLGSVGAADAAATAGADATAAAAPGILSGLADILPFLFV